MKRNLACIALALVAAGCATRIDVQGHRGARGLAPENTLPAFEKALSLGVTTLELDTAVTKDGVVVIGHDPSPNPDIARLDGKWIEKASTRPIHEMTFAELQRYDIGRLKPETAYAKRYPEQVAVDGTRYSRLADLFALVRRSGDRQVRFNIETKVSPLAPYETLPPEAFARALVAEIRANRMTDRATIQSFDWRTLQLVQKREPTIPTVYLTVQTPNNDNVKDERWTAGFKLADHGGSVPRMIKAAGGAVWSRNQGAVTEALVKEAQGLGLKVIPWTVNEPAAMERLIDWGVDGIITDYPNRLREVMQRKRMPLPRPIQ